MKSFFRRAFTPTAAFLATAALAQAHPGHDGHELTWDFTHLAAHPVATILCFGVIGGIAWGAWKLIRPTDEAPKAVRVRADDGSRREG